MNDRPDSQRGPIAQPPILGRRRMIVLREAEYDKASYEAPDLFTDTETWVVNYDTAISGTLASPALERLVKLRMLRPDRVLLLSPYDDSYVEIDQAEEAFSLRKLEIFTTLCSLLGARDVVAARDDVDDFERTGEGRVDVSKGVASGTATLSQDLRRKVAQRLRLTATFDPGEPQIDAAVELLERHALADDDTMRGLVDLFRYGGGRVRSKELLLNITSEASREVRAAASLKVPTILSISGSFRGLDKRALELVVELRVTF